jgi:hypothetical protein
MTLDESRHARKLAQALREGDHAEQRRSADWKAHKVLIHRRPIRMRGAMPR